MKKKINNILITGGAGYVGSLLVDLLLRSGFDVAVLDSLLFGGNSLIPYFSHKNFKFVKGDIRNKEDIDKALKNADLIIHLAAIVGFPACIKYPELSEDINVNGTRSIVNSIEGKRPILFASTGSVYGKMTQKICTEQTPLNPLTNYGIQKAEAEKIIKKNNKFVIYRFATAFGVSPRLRLDLMPNDFTYKAVKEKSLIVYEKKFMRTFIHVRDMARAFLLAIENYDKMEGEIYNVGDSSMNYSKEDICLMIKKRVDYYLHFAEIGKDLDQRDYIVSYEKLAKLGFNTSITMEQGIDELIKVSEVLEAHDQYKNI